MMNMINKILLINIQMDIILLKSPKKTKKYRVIVGGKNIDFGAKGYSDYTIHKDKERMKRYLLRHKKNENWKKTGIITAGFWSRWLLWNKPTMKESIKNIEKKFKIKITAFNI